MANEPTPNQSRLASIDTYRGFVMFLMLAEVMRLPAVARAFPGSGFWKFLGEQQTHVEWQGCSLHDLIQPSFSFLVGVAMPFSLASRAAQGQQKWVSSLHAFWRGFALVGLGIFLRSLSAKQTNYTFEDTLTQIGLGYPLLYFIALGPPRLRWVSVGLILLGYWALFAFFPVPPDDSSWLGVPSDWPHHPTGFAAHWDKNSTPAWEIDYWFLNLFPRSEPFLYNRGGYATSSFFPTLATMILGVSGGELLKSNRSSKTKVLVLVIAGVTGLSVGYALGYFGLCPIVKRIWTPSWVLFSGGWCALLLAFFFAATDWSGYRGWAFPLIVIGANSIAAYVGEHLFMHFITDALKRHFGAENFQMVSPKDESFLLGFAALVVFWLGLFWMYRRRLFIKV